MKRSNLAVKIRFWPSKRKNVRLELFWNLTFNYKFKFQKQNRFFFFFGLIFETHLGPCPPVSHLRRDWLFNNRTDFTLKTSPNPQVYNVMVVWFFLRIYIFQFFNGENSEKKSKLLGNYLHYKNTSFQKVPKFFGEKTGKFCPKISLVRPKSRAKSGDI